MGDAARDLGPGGLALGGDEIGDVVEGDDIAARTRFVRLQSDPYEQQVMAVAAHHAELAFHPRPPGAELGEKRQHLGHHLVDRETLERTVVGGQECARRRVHEGDAAAHVEAEHPRRDARHHRLGEAPAGVELEIGLEQLALLARDLRGHAVEGAAQGGDLVVGFRLRHAGEKIAPSHPLGRRHELGERGREPVGEGQTRPHRREQHEQGHDREDERGGDLDVRAFALHVLVFGHHRLAVLDEAQHLRIDEAAHHQVEIAEPLELEQGAHAVVALAREHDHLAAIRAFEQLERQPFDLEGETEPAAGDDAAAGIEDHRLAERAQGGLGFDELLQPAGAVEIEGEVAAQIRRHGQGVGADVGLVLLEIGAGDLERVVERGVDALAEPGLEPRAQEHDGEDGDDDARGHGDEAEQGHEPGMETRARAAAPPFEDDPHDPAGDHEAEQEQEHEVEVQEQQYATDAGTIGRCRGQLEVGEQRRDDRGHGERERRAALEVDFPQPLPQPAGCETEVGRHAPLPRRGRGQTRGAKRMPSSRIFLRRVLRLRPKSSAARSWLPPVNSRARAMSGRSTSRSTRW